MPHPFNQAVQWGGCGGHVTKHTTNGHIVGFRQSVTIVDSTFEKITGILQAGIPSPHQINLSDAEQFVNFF
jgi:hypothetical protein